MKLLCAIFIIFIAMGFAFTANAENSGRVATVVDIEGSADIEMPFGDVVKAEKGMVLSEGFSVKTKDNSMVALEITGTLETSGVEVKENSEMLLAEMTEDRDAGTVNTLLDLAVGEILVTSQKLRSEKSKFEVKTPTSLVGVRGTTFAVAVSKEV